MITSRTIQQEERLASAIVGAAIAVHRVLGPGLLEQVYEICFCYELQKRAIQTERQVLVPIIYDAIVLEQSLRIDLLVEGLIVCELKLLKRCCQFILHKR